MRCGNRAYRLLDSRFSADYRNDSKHLLKQPRHFQHGINFWDGWLSGTLQSARSHALQATAVPTAYLYLRSVTLQLFWYLPTYIHGLHSTYSRMSAKLTACLNNDTASIGMVFPYDCGYIGITKPFLRHIARICGLCHKELDSLSIPMIDEIMAC
jgi:hypothetical protein